MNPVDAQQVGLDNALVAPEKRLKIEKCNMRIKFNKPQREPTYQVTLDVLKLSPCYPTFLITAKDQMHWRTFDVVINKCISGKSTGLEGLRPLRAKILWGMFYKDNVGFVALQWENFMFQADNKDINKTISMRNKINLHTIRDDSLLGRLKFVSKTEDYQNYGSLVPKQMINQAIKESKEYKIYLSFSTREATPKKERSLSGLRNLNLLKQAKTAEKSAIAKKSSTMQTVGVVIRDTFGVFVSKKKVLAKVDRGKGMDLLSDVALLEAAQLKKILKRRKQDTHMLQASGSGDGVGFQSKIPDELQNKTTSTNEGIDTIPWVPNVPTDQSKSENESWGNSRDDDDSNDDISDDGVSKYDEEEYEEEYVPTHTPKNYESTDDENKHEDEEECEELYKDVNMRSYTSEFEKNAHAEKKRYIDLIEKSVKDIINDEALVNSYNVDKDLFEVYGKVVSLKRGVKTRIKIKTLQLDQTKPAQAEGPIHTADGTKVQHNQGQDMGNTDDQPNVEAVSKYDWFKKPERPLPPDPDCNARKSVDFRPPQT
uniref:Uncharacterized protein n=1 Tax=Tanacetum cinerariifolium TaxID=118510 RepID=A0A6L2JMN4_TANCI|nr:hypothetical protein [Tanacetum cinerariifolium]